tara:strand:+ start:750 stop:1112 length:363 start_codon:yes stop_codon:yes gene_type:complete
MTFNGVEIFYSALANEILREFQTAFFCGDGPGDQTHFNGICEGVLVMSLLARKDFPYIAELRTMPRDQRHSIVISFAMEHDEEIARLQPEILARVEATMASSVESVELGKSQPPPLDSSP